MPISRDITRISVSYPDGTGTARIVVVEVTACGRGDEDRVAWGDDEEEDDSEADRVEDREDDREDEEVDEHEVQVTSATAITSPTDNTNNALRRGHILLETLPDDE
jgi:hypothetical protein